MTSAGEDPGSEKVSHVLKSIDNDDPLAPVPEHEDKYFWGPQLGTGFSDVLAFLIYVPRGHLRKSFSP